MFWELALGGAPCGGSRHKTLPLDFLDGVGEGGFVSSRALQKFLDKCEIFWYHKKELNNSWKRKEVR